LTVCYRLHRGTYRANSGIGASLHGGRWNKQGTEVIYASESRALAALEIITKYKALPDDYLVTKISIPDNVAVETVNIRRLPAKWNAAQPKAATVRLGDEWVQGCRSAVLRVPSAVFADEWNYVLNPTHPDFPRIKFHKPKRLRIDPRLVIVRR
jgi:RES domain-containing protein